MRKSQAIPRRDMTADEITLALALSPTCVRFVTGSGDKRFAWSVADQAEHGTPPQITERQAAYLVRLCLRMRRQLAPDVLAIAERLAQPVPCRESRVSPRTAVALLTVATFAGGVIQRATAAVAPPTDSAEVLGHDDR